MAVRRPKITIREKLTAEGQAMNEAFKVATERAAAETFKVRKTILVEKDGWLVRVYKDGRIWRKVKALEPLRAKRSA